MLLPQLWFGYVISEDNAPCFLAFCFVAVKACDKTVSEALMVLVKDITSQGYYYPNKNDGEYFR